MVVDGETGLRAIVIGAGFAGLTATAGLSKLFDNVTLLDRDELKRGVSKAEAADQVVWRQEFEDEAKRRKGVSQYTQPHVMLLRGMQGLEQLFPGYTQKLHDAGAVPVDLLGDFTMDDWGMNWSPGQASEFKGVSITRHMYENIAREFVLDIPNVSLQTGAAVSGLEYDASTSQVTGVRLKTGEVMSADLVVDASGGNSRVGKWLEQIGHPTPPTMSVDAGLQYTCCMYEFPKDPSRDWQIAMCADNPKLTSINVVVPIEHNRWHVVLSGYRGHHCPSDQAGFIEFARNLPSPTIYNAIKTAKPVAPISVFTQTANSRRSFEHVPPPSGLCVIGDASCRFNPVFGQGMSVAVMGSHLLCTCVEEALAKAGGSRQQRLAALKGMPGQFQTQLASLQDLPWSMSTGADAMRPDAKVDMPTARSNPLTSLVAAYIQYLQKARFLSPYIMTKFTLVQHLLAPPTSLLKADVVTRAALVWLQSKLAF